MTMHVVDQQNAAIRLTLLHADGQGDTMQQTILSSQVREALEAALAAYDATYGRGRKAKTLSTKG